MCLIICKKSGVTLDREELSNAMESNPDGVGIAFPEQDKVAIRKGFWNIEKLDEELSAVEHLPVLIHFRLATHGGETLDNTHPFQLNNGWAMAHNGIISNIKAEQGESDTRAFIRHWVNPIVEKHSVLEWKKEIEEFIGLGNKLAFINPKGEFSIFNEKAGHWRQKDGCWYSNSTYLYSYPLYGYGRYGIGGYHDEWPNLGSQKTECCPSTRMSEEGEWTEAYNVKNLRCNVCNRKINAEFFIEREHMIIMCGACK